MKYDVYIDEVSGTAEIYIRGDVPGCGLKPDGKPVFSCEASSTDWSEWLDNHTDWRDDCARRVFRLRCSFPKSFVKDLEAKAQRKLDAYREGGKSLGCGELKIDRSWTTHTCRASANWKEEPTRYTFDQHLKWDNPLDMSKAETLSVWDEYISLLGMADAVYELGFTLTFDSDFRVHLMNAHAEWREVED